MQAEGNWTSFNVPLINNATTMKVAVSSDAAGNNVAATYTAVYGANGWESTDPTNFTVDTNGNFAVKNLDTGTWYIGTVVDTDADFTTTDDALTISPQPVTVPRQTPTGSLTAGSSGDSITGTWSDLNLRTQNAGSVMTVTLKDETGTHTLGTYTAQNTASGWETSEPSGFSIDSNGNFVLTDLLPGTYSLSATVDQDGSTGTTDDILAQGPLPVTVYDDSAPTGTLAASYSSAGVRGTWTNLQVNTADPGSSMTVTVKNADGTATLATYTAEHTASGWVTNEPQNFSIDSDGNFLITGLDPATYQIYADVDKDGSGSTTDDILTQGPLPVTVRTVRPPTGNLVVTYDTNTEEVQGTWDNLNLNTSDPGSTITVNIKDPTGTNTLATYTATYDGNSWTSSDPNFSVDDNGNFTLAGLDPGDYQIETLVDGDGDPTTTDDILNVSPTILNVPYIPPTGSLAVSYDTTDELAHGTWSDLNLKTSDPGSTMTVTVKDGTGENTLATYTATHTASGWESTDSDFTIDTNGNFTIAGLDPGNYRIYADVDKDGDPATTGDVLAIGPEFLIVPYISPTASNLDIAYDSTDDDVKGVWTDLDLKTRDPGSIMTVAVTNLDGTPVTSFTAEHTDTGWVSSDPNFTVDDNGNFAIAGIYPGTYNFTTTIDKDGDSATPDALVQGPTQVTIDNIHMPTGDILLSYDKPSRLLNGTWSDLDLKTTDDGSTITVTVKNSRGQTVGAYQAEHAGTSWTSQSADMSIDNSGNYAIAGLSPGVYTVTTAVDGDGDTSTPIDLLTLGPTQVIVPDLHPTGTLNTGYNEENETIDARWRLLDLKTDEPGSTMRIRLLDRNRDPIIDVTATHGTTGWSSPLVTDFMMSTNGNFSFANQESGTYYIEAEVDSDGDSTTVDDITNTGPLEIVVPWDYHPTGDLSVAYNTDASAVEGNWTNLDLRTTEDGSTMKISVTDTSGNEVASYTATHGASGWSGNTPSFEIDYDGTFRIYGLSQGRYNVTATVDGDGNSGTRFDVTSFGPEPVTVPLNDVQPTGTLSATYDKDDEGIYGTWANLDLKGKTNGSTMTIAIDGEDGAVMTLSAHLQDGKWVSNSGEKLLIGTGGNFFIPFTQNGNFHVTVLVDRDGNSVTKNDLLTQQVHLSITDAPHIPKSVVKIHFGTGNDSSEDYYYINKRDATLEGLGLSDITIETQEKAQNALLHIKNAIEKKDSIRAYYGGMQNRLENTIANLEIQNEGLLSAESRISDVNVAEEMTRFIRNQILAKTATAMLAQANQRQYSIMDLLQ